MNTMLTEQELREEKVNYITHVLGILYGLVGIPLLINTALTNATPALVWGTVVYALSFLMVFTFSTLFHFQKGGRLRHIFKILDHVSIYFLIAGTYTPFILRFVNNAFGHTMLIVLWTLTVIGSVLKIFFTGKFEILSTVIYLAMGWMLLSGADTFFASMPRGVQTLIIIGGCLYSIGVIFYLWRLFSYHHAVWHLFVLGAAICHFIAVMMSV